MFDIWDANCNDPAVNHYSDDFADNDGDLAEMGKEYLRMIHYHESTQDGSGAISSKELLGVMRAMGQNPTEDELLNLVMEVDLDGNGTIEFPEFLEMMKSKAAEVDQESDLREAFKIFDRDRDGYIDMKELKKVDAVIF